MEFRHVQLQVYVGGWQLKKFYRVQVISGSDTPIDLATIEIPAENVAMEAIVKGMAVKIYMGYYDTGIWLVFSGLVKDVSWGRTVIIYCKDLMDVLRSTKIIQSFTDAEPAVIMKYMFGKAGIEDYIISSQAQTVKHHFILSNQSVLQAQRLLNRAWNLDWLFYREPEGLVVWQPLEETERYDNGNPVGLLEYGKNLMDLKPTETMFGTLTTFLLPFLRHGQVIRLRDVRYWATDVKVLLIKLEYSYLNGVAETRASWKILES